MIVLMMKHVIMLIYHSQCNKYFIYIIIQLIKKKIIYKNVKLLNLTNIIYHYFEYLIIIYIILIIYYNIIKSLNN